VVEQGGSAVSPLTLVLIGVAVFVVLGAIGVLKMGDRIDRVVKRKAKDAERRRAAEDEVW
jgi:hypothetical protein